MRFLTNFFISCTVGGTLLFIYRFREYRLARNKLLKKENNTLNKVIFFSGVDVEECVKHLYSRTYCARPECPYPKLKCLLDLINSCTQSLQVCIHIIGSAHLADAIITAHKRGVDVYVIADGNKSTTVGSLLPQVMESGIPVRIPPNCQMHCKLAILDGTILMIGSMNWTVQALAGNWENMVITSEEHIVADAVKAFNNMWDRNIGID